MTAPRIALKKKNCGAQSRTRISVTSPRVHVRVNCVDAQWSVRTRISVTSARVHVRVNCVDAQWSVQSVQPLPPVFTGWFRTFLQTWPKKKWQSSSSATTVACARQVKNDLSFVVASLSQFHRLHSEWVK